MKILYSYYSKKLPPLLPYTFHFLRRMYDGEVVFLTNEDFPQTELFEQYNITRLHGLDKYKNIRFYNEYKILGIRDYADDDTVYMDIDIFFDDPIFIKTISERQDFFANKYWSQIIVTGAYFLKEKAPNYGYNGGIIKLSSPLREEYCAAALKMFERVKPFATKIPVIDAVAEEVVGASFKEISFIGERYGDGPGWVHLMEPTQKVLDKLQMYKEFCDEKDK